MTLYIVSAIVVFVFCSLLTMAGLGARAYESMQQANIRPIVTNVATIDEAVTRWHLNRPCRKVTLGEEVANQ